MSDIHLSRTHRLDAASRERALEALLTFLQSTLSATAQRSDNRVVFNGKGFSGSLSLGEDRVDGSVQLGFLMRPMKGAITREIERALEEYLQDQ